MRMTEEQYAAILARKGAKAPAKPVVVRKSKYGNRKTEVDGITFDSAKEAKRYQELRLMEGKAHEIEGLLYQVRFPLTVNGVKVGTYVADFTYHDKYGYQVEDCKGYRTPVYKLKKLLMLAIHGITIRETK